MINPLFHWRAAIAVLIGAVLAAAPAQAHPAALQAAVEAHIALPPAVLEARADVAPAAAPAQPQLPQQAVAPEPGRSVLPHGAAGSSPVDTSACARPTFSQPFAQFGDFGSYTLMPGESLDSFAATGWKLSRGAHVVDTKLQDGTTGAVLDMPSGSSAVSPPMCVAINYPTARTMIRDVSGFAGLQFLVAYQGSKTWARPRHTGLVHGNSASWTLSHPFKLQPARKPGWQIVRFGIFAIGHHSDYQLYNTYVDPHFLK